VGAGEESDLTVNVSDLVVLASVEALTCEDEGAGGVSGGAFDGVVDLGEGGGVAFVAGGGTGVEGLFLDCGEGAAAFGFGGVGQGFVPGGRQVVDDGQAGGG